MKSSLFLFCCLLFLSFSCTSEDPKNTSIKKKGEEDSLVERYMKEMIANPTNQDHTDRNLIIDLLLDSLWDFQKTASGIYYQIEKAGQGTHPNLDSWVKCHYRGTLLNGQVFDTSRKRKEPMEFNLRGVIAGWQEVIPMLKKGGKGTFIIPSRLAYGATPPTPKIPPHSVLIFDIELQSFETPEELEF